MAHIPSNLHEEILCLLPSNSLLNLKCVCKDWNELISSQRFIQKHFHRSKTECSATLIAMLSPSKITVCDISTGNESRWSIPYPLEFSFNNTKIAGSCDGLVCLVQGRSKVFAIINPSTGKSEVTITDRFVFGPRQGYWFGKHPSTGEYSIIAIETSLDLIQVYQFSSKKTSLQNFSIGITLSQSDIILILLHGALHWPVIQCDVRSTLVVLAYDIQKNKLLQIWTPFEPAVVTLGIVDGCLSAIIDTCPDTCQDSRLELWIMKEYGVEESWTKYANIEDFKEYRALSPLGFLSDGDLILDVDDKKIAKYSFSDKKGTFLCVYRGDNFEKNKSAVLCVDSLVSPALFWKD